jgi:hypothetical protein
MPPKSDLSDFGAGKGNQAALPFRSGFLYGRAPGEESVGMRNYGRVLMATMLLATSVFGEVRAGTVEPGAELTPEMFKPLPEITCAKKGLAGLTKQSCKCVKCNEPSPDQPLLCWRVC